MSIPAFAQEKQVHHRLGGVLGAFTELPPRMPNSSSSSSSNTGVLIYIVFFVAFGYHIVLQIVYLRLSPSIYIIV